MYLTFMVVKRLALLLSLLLCVEIASADTFTIDGIEYYRGYSSSSTVQVNGYTSDLPADVVIPSQVTYLGKTYSVTSIGSSAFKSCTSLTSIEIPNSVALIGNNAFYDCISLTSIDLPNRITSIGESAFKGCSALTSIAIPNNDNVITIWRYAFSGCTSLATVEVPSSVKDIYHAAFSDCTSLTTVIISDGDAALTINGELFTNCPLKEVYVGRNLSYSDANYSPFCNQSELSKVVLSNSVTRIGLSAFSGCTSLASIEIPNSVTSIEKKAFDGCTSLTSIKIPNSVFFIEVSAFNGCTSLANINIIDGNRLLKIDGESVLFEDSPLKEVYWGRDLQYSSKYSPFRNQKDLINVTIGNSVTSIRQSAFEGCTSLASIEIPNSVISIGESAFKGCTTLANVIISDGNSELDSDDSYIFDGCSLKEVYLGRNFEYTSPFKNQNQLAKITIGANVTEIKSSEFEGCVALSIVVIDDCTNPLDCFATLDDSPLKEVYLGRNISYSPFKCQKGLTKVTIGDKVTNINDFTFGECDSIMNIEIKNCTAQFESSAFENSVYRNANLIIKDNKELPLNIRDYSWKRFNHVFYAEGDNIFLPILWSYKLDCPDSFYSSEDGCLISVDCNKTSVYNNSNTFVKSIFRNQDITNDIASTDGFSLEPSTLWMDNIIYTFGSENIGTSRNISVSDAGQLFNELGMQDIQSVEFLTVTGDLNGTDIMTINRMTSLKYLDLSAANIVEGGMTYHEDLKTENDVFGDYFFNNLKTLRLILMPNSVISIGCEVLNENIQTVILPRSVVTIGNDAFYRCTSLISINIPDGVSTIGIRAFYGCSALYAINIPNSVTTIENLAFASCTSMETFRIPNSVITIGGSAFEGCTSIESIIIPDNVTTVGPSTFKDCSSLKSVEIGNGLIKIESGIFSGCTSLAYVEIGNHVSSIKETAFKNCTALSNIYIADGYNVDVFIDKNAFKECPLKELYLGRNLDCGYNYQTSTYESPFKNKKSLTNVIVGSDVSHIYYNSFENCSSLTSVNIPNSVTWIGRCAFYNCTSLASIEIPSSVASIGWSAFHGCSSLNSVHISDIVAWCNISFGDYDANPLCCAHSLYINGELATNIIIPNSIKNLNDYTFYGCNTMSSITLPTKVTSIGISAFEGCSSLTSIEVPSNVASIGWNAFTGCSALESLLLGSGLTSVGNNAFKGCTALKVIKSLNPTPPAIKSSTFDGVDKEACQLIVTKGNLAYYWLDPYWKEFLNISDDLLALNPLPIVRYGDGSVNLADYAPEGVSLTYESSNSDVAKIEGSMLTICGAGEATVSASIAEEGTPMEIIGQMRTFIVNKADLTVTAESYEIEQGDPMPDFAIKYDGFAYDDNADSLDELPMIICEATETSKAGEYEISLKGGTDSNYNMNLINGRLIIKDSDAVDNVESDNAPFSCVFVDREIHISGLADSQIVYVYDTSGLLCYYGDSRNGEVLTYRPNKSGMYIVKSGRHNVKVLVM